jgi:two-component system, OmpR family, alkaline phosphatase synthesis response regulator PhoP
MMMKTSEIKILVVDDEKDTIEFLAYNLKKEGYLVYTASNGYKALQEVQRISPHLVLLDIMMPEMDGIETCEKIKENPANKNIMIVFLTARKDDYSQIAGFGVGADDFINKPIKPKLLVFRLNAILKRYGSKSTKEKNTDEILTFKDLIIDPEKYIVYYKDQELLLPKKEFRLLQILTSRPSKVFTREEIFEQLWGSDNFVGDRTIDVYIRKLRMKIGNKRIVTIKGIGYKFEPSK